MVENNIMALVGAFIGIAILLGIGTQILGNSVQDCTNLSDYDTTSGATQTGWAAQCEANNEQTQCIRTINHRINCDSCSRNFDSSQNALSLKNLNIFTFLNNFNND